MFNLKKFKKILYNVVIYKHSEMFFSNAMFNLTTLIVFSHLIFAAHNSLITLKYAVVYLLLIIFIYYKKSSLCIKYIFIVISVILFVAIIYKSHPNFNYVTRFIYIVPLLYAISLRDLFSPTISGIGIVFIFSTYLGEVGQDVINSTSIGLFFACAGYTVNSVLVKKLNQDNEKLHQMNITDNLTGLATLSHTIEMGQKMLDKGSNVTSVIIDLDNFKQFNDTYGHLAANKVLIQFGQLLKRKTKGLNCIAGRLGGDEFIIFIEEEFNYQNQNFSNFLLESLKDELFEIEQELGKIKIDFSIGEASTSSQQSISNIEELINKADINMYYNKLNKKRINSNIELHNVIMTNQSSHLLQTLAEKDMYTYIHSKYTAQYAVELARALNMQDTMIKNLNIAGWYHDIGKVLITNSILRKNTKLDDYEYSIVKQHVTNGSHILFNNNFSNSVISAIIHHHERWDGKGYPYGIIGKNTPIEGRILQIADTFSAITVKRVYHEPLSLEDALLEIQKNSGTQFDPQLVKVFINMFENKKIAI